MQQELQEFHMIDATPALATNTRTKADEAITAVPADKLIVKGAQLAPGPLPARLDVDEFVKNERFLALYIQAVSRIHKDPEDQLQSYYQVAGLHGVPLVVWNQSEGSGAYCRHASPLFPTWHRPYVALFEVNPSDCCARFVAVGVSFPYYSKSSSDTPSKSRTSTRPKRKNGSRPHTPFVSPTGIGPSPAVLRLLISS